jgi:hypothetical protein
MVGGYRSAKENLVKFLIPRNKPGLTSNVPYKSEIEMGSFLKLDPWITSMKLKVRSYGKSQSHHGSVEDEKI